MTLKLLRIFSFFRIDKLWQQIWHIEFRLAWRYLRAGNASSSFFNTNVRLAIVFMTSMIAVIIMVFSVFYGFQNSIYETLLKSAPHIRIEHQFTKTFPKYDDLISYIQQEIAIDSNQLPGTGTSPAIQFIYPELSVPVLFPGLSSYEIKNFFGIPSTMIRPKSLQSASQTDRLAADSFSLPVTYFNDQALKDFSQDDYILIGSEMAQNYGYALGDRVNLLLPQRAHFANLNDIVEHSFVIAGFFKTGFYEFDQNHLYVSLNVAQRTLDLAGRVNSIAIQVASQDQLYRGETLISQIVASYDFYQSEGLSKDAMPPLGETDITASESRSMQIEAEKLQIPMYAVSTIQDERKNLFQALQLEKTLLLVILSLLIFAGIIGIWISIALLVKSKEYSIGVLKAMGLPAATIIRIFCLSALMMGLMSLIIGSVFGIFATYRLESMLYFMEDGINALCPLLQDNCVPIQIIPSNIYYVDHLPVAIDIDTIYILGVMTLILSTVAGYIPARSIMRLNPIKILSFQ